MEKSEASDSGPKHAPSSEETPTPSPSPLRSLLLFAAVLATGSSFILSLLLLGELGNRLVGVLSLLVAFVFGMATFLDRKRAGEALRQLSTTGKALSAVALVALSVVVAGVVFGLARSEPIVVVPDVRVDGGEELTAQTPATIVFEGRTPARENLRLDLALIDDVGSGDCTGDAQLTLDPMIGDVELPSVGVPRPGVELPGEELQLGEPVTIPVGGPVSDLRVRVRLDSQTGCRLGLRVTEAVFHA